MSVPDDGRWTSPTLPRSRPAPRSRPRSYVEEGSSVTDRLLRGRAGSSVGGIRAGTSRQSCRTPSTGQHPVHRSSRRLVPHVGRLIIPRAAFDTAARLPPAWLSRARHGSVVGKAPGVPERQRRPREAVTIMGGRRSPPPTAPSALPSMRGAGPAPALRAAALPFSSWQTGRSPLCVGTTERRSSRHQTALTRSGHQLDGALRCGRLDRIARPGP